MRIWKASDYKEMSRRAAKLIAAQVLIKPDCVLGLATGSTPIGLYECLVEWHRMGDLDFSKVSSVNLDEYRGLSKDNEQSYYSFMHRHLFSKVNIQAVNACLPDGLAEDVTEECERYERLIQSLGGVDMQLLGIGHNGHIGFNEPGAQFDLATHCVKLQERTIEANKRFFASAQDVPKEAYSMGIGTIMKARRIVLAVSGADKAETLKKALLGPITPEVPASILQMHPDVTVVADAAALAWL